MFESYRNKYENVRMKREDGILEVALQSETCGTAIAMQTFLADAVLTLGLGLLRA